MAAWLRNTILTIVFISIGLAIWKIYGGDLGSFFTMIYDVFYTIVDAVSNVIVNAWNGITNMKH